MFIIFIPGLSIEDTALAALPFLHPEVKNELDLLTAVRGINLIYDIHDGDKTEIIGFKITVIDRSNVTFYILQ